MTANTQTARYINRSDDIAAEMNDDDDCEKEGAASCGCSTDDVDKLVEFTAVADVAEAVPAMAEAPDPLPTEEEEAGVPVATFPFASCLVPPPCASMSAEVAEVAATVAAGTEGDVFGVPPLDLAILL